MLPTRFNSRGSLFAFAATLLVCVVVREGPSPVINQSVIWLPTGVAIAGLFLLGPRAWWVVALVTIVQRMLLHYPVQVALTAAGGSAAEALLGLWVLRRLDVRPSFERLRDVGALFVAAMIAPLGSIFFSWIGRMFVWPDPNMPFYSGWDGWWRMNLLGAITAVPIALAWLSPPGRPWSAQTLLGVASALVAVPVAVLGAMVLVPSGLVGVLLLNLLLTPVILYAAGRFGVRGGTLVGTLAAIVVAIATARGVGPFLALRREHLHESLQLFELGFVALPPAFGALLAELRAAQRLSARSDELRRSMQAALPDVVYRLGRDGTVREVSAPKEGAGALPWQDLTGRLLAELIPPEKLRALRRATHSVFTNGGPVTVEYEVALAGERRVREARCVRHGDDEILAVVRDITERKWGEGTKNFEADVLRLVATGAPASIVFERIVDGMESLFPGGRCSVILLEGRRMRVTYAPSLPREYNATIDGVEIGESVGSCGSAAATGRTVIVRDIATHPLWEGYAHLALPHGLRACWSVPIRDSSGGVLGTVAIYYDEPREPAPHELALAERAGALAGIVLERERRVDALQRSEDLLASINHNVKEGIFRASPDLTVQYANRAFAAMFGVDPPRDVAGFPLADSFEQPERLDTLRALVRDQGQWLNEEVRFRRRDGTAFWGRLSGIAVLDRQGVVTHFDGAIADVTERKQLEEQFRQSQKLEAVGRLAGGVAHDFNNLLTVILGHAEGIRDAGGVPSAIRSHADQVLDASRRAADLTHQLLAYSRQQVLSPRVLDLTEVVDQMSGLLRRLIGEHLTLSVEHRTGPCWVRVDRSQLEQVLMNLAVNARDAMPGGGRVTIRTRAAVGDALPAFARPVIGSGPAVLLEVRDTGIGMSSDVQARAFDPFFTTKPPGEGTGLGLSTVQGIVHQSGGEVGIESAPRLGTTVWIALPRCEAPVEESGRPAAAPAPAGEGTVLVVEDEPGVRSLVCSALAREGYDVLEASDGESALVVSRDHRGGIDLVVSDVVMPRMGGRELALRLRAERPDVRFLFVSGYPEDADATSDLAEGANAFLAKPFGPAQLTIAARAVIRGPAPPSTPIP